MNVSDVLTDLVAEQAALDPIVRGLSDATGTRPRRARGGRVTDQIAHLTYFDRTAAFAIESTRAVGRGDEPAVRRRRRR